MWNGLTVMIVVAGTACVSAVPVQKDASSTVMVTLLNDARLRDIARRLVATADQSIWRHDVWALAWEFAGDQHRIRPIAAHTFDARTQRHYIMVNRFVLEHTTDDELAFLVAHELGHAVLNDNANMMARASRLPFGKERFADAFGVLLGADAGFDMRRATDEYCTFLQQLERAERTFDTFAPDGAHPPAAERCKQLRAVVDDQ